METLDEFKLIIGCATLLDLPIRDGNLLSSSTMGGGIFLLDLPIRDGNWIALSTSPTVSRLLDLPIRDGNL